MGTYYLGATIVSRAVLARMQKYSDKVFAFFGRDCVVQKEVHITILPPFHADYETASKINQGCAVSTLLSEHPLVTTVFSVEELQIMSFAGLDIIHFPVRVHKKYPGDCNFVEYVQALRQKVKTFGIEFVEEIPEKYKPHITVLVGEGLKNKTGLQTVVKESDKEKPLFFHSGYPTLYAKYPDIGWQTISENPMNMK